MGDPATEISREVSGARARSVFFALRQIVWLLTPEGAVERFNPFWSEYTGLPERVEGLAWASVIHPEDRQRLVNARTLGVASESPYEVEARMRRRDGVYRRHICRVAPLHDDGELFGWLGTAIDVENVRAAEDTAREAERRKQAVLESMSDGYYRLDRAFRLVDVNAAFERMTGKRRAEVLTQYLWTAFPDAPTLETYTRIPLDRAFTEERWSGAAKRWVEISIFRSPDGFEAYFRDISDRKAMEARREEERATLAAVIEALPAVAWLSDPAGALLHLNQRWYSYTGQAPEDAVGSGWACAVHPDDAQHAAVAAAAAITAGNSYEVEVRYRRRDGAYRWHLARAEPIRDTAGAITGWVGAAADVDHLKSG